MELMSILGQLAYILPLLMVIYQLGRVMAEHHRMHDDILKLEKANKELTEKMENADKENAEKIDDVKAASDTALAAILSQLNGLSVSIARIETTMNIDKMNKDAKR